MTYKVAQIVATSVAVAVIALVVAFKSCKYFPESSFELASTSRPPKWIAVSPGVTRENVRLTMNYYTYPFMPNTLFILQQHGKEKTEVAAKILCRIGEPGSEYPTYNVIKANGEIEIIEHKKMEPIFYVTDDSNVWESYRKSECH